MYISCINIYPLHLSLKMFGLCTTCWAREAWKQLFKHEFGLVIHRAKRKYIPSNFRMAQQFSLKLRSLVCVCIYTQQDHFLLFKPPKKKTVRSHGEGGKWKEHLHPSNAEAFRFGVFSQAIRVARDRVTVVGVDHLRAVVLRRVHRRRHGCMHITVHSRKKKQRRLVNKRMLERL